MAVTSFVDSLIDKGMNREDLAHVSRAMVFHFNQVNEVHTKIANCTNCEFAKECVNRPLSGTGNMNPEVVVVSDVPENNEARFGMVGFAEYSIYLMAFFKKLGIEWNDIFWTHAVKCKTDQKTKMRHINECHVNLVNQLAILKPTVIVALGTTAISSLAGEPLKIGDAIGGEFYFSIGNQDVPVIPIEHPRTFLNTDKRDDLFKDKTRETWRQLKAITDIMEGSDDEDEDFDDDDELSEEDLDPEDFDD